MKNVSTIELISMPVAHVAVDDFVQRELRREPERPRHQLDDEIAAKRHLADERVAEEGREDAVIVRVGRHRASRRKFAWPRRRGNNRSFGRAAIGAPEL